MYHCMIAYWLRESTKSTKLRAVSSFPIRPKRNLRILFAKWSGTEVKLNGEDRLIIKESEILGVIEE